jgi:serine/threonine protein kinase
MAAAPVLPPLPPAIRYDFRPIGINMWLNGTAQNSLLVNTTIANNNGNQFNIFPLRDDLIPNAIAGGGYPNSRSVLRHTVNYASLRVNTVLQGGNVILNFIQHTAANPSFITIGGVHYYIQGQTFGGSYGRISRVSTDPAVPGNYILKLQLFNNNKKYRNCIKECIINSIVDKEYHNNILCQFANRLYAVAGDIDISILHPNPANPATLYPYYVCMIQERLDRTVKDLLTPLPNPNLEDMIKNIIYQISAKLQILWANSHFNHVDLKGDNIMIDMRGSYRLIDFGFSRMDPFLNTNKIVADPIPLSTRSSESRDLTQLFWYIWHYANGNQLPIGSRMKNLFRYCLINIPGLDRLSPDQLYWFQNGVDLSHQSTRQPPGQTIRDANSYLTMNSYKSLFYFGNRFNNSHATPTVVKNYLEQVLPNGYGPYPAETYGINQNNCIPLPPFPQNPGPLGPHGPLGPLGPAAAAPRRGGGEGMKGLIFPVLSKTIGGQRKYKKLRKSKKQRKSKSKRT